MDPTWQVFSRNTSQFPTTNVLGERKQYNYLKVKRRKRSKLSDQKNPT